MPPVTAAVEPVAVRPRALRAPLLFLLVLCAGLAPASPLSAQQVFGRVYDAESSDAVALMDVVLLDANGRTLARTVSDPEGRFLFPLGRQGLYQLAVSRIGYDSTATAEFTAASQDLYVDVYVRPMAVEAEPIVVTVSRLIPALEANGFYARRGRGTGTYIDSNRIERFGGTFPSQLLRTVPGVQVRRGVVLMRRCAPKLIVDGMEARGAQIDDVVRLESIEALEIYPGPSTIPPEYKARASCLLMVWTKR